jgi:hypothetical protein
MNLNFTTLETVTIKDKPYYRQRAPITSDIRAAFWSAWRPPNSPLKAVCEIQQDSGVWYVYRFLPLAPDTPCAPARLSYIPKRSSIKRLLPYQVRSFSHLCNTILTNQHAFDGSDTGLGKTYVAAAVCLELGLTPGIICKLPGVSAWHKALEYIGVKPAFILNWESAKIGGRRFPYLTRTADKWGPGYSYEWRNLDGKLLIFDEAHSANNADSQNCQFLMSSKKYPSLCLSATFADRAYKMQPFLDLCGAMTAEAFSRWLNERGFYTNQYDTPESLQESTEMALIHNLLYPKYGYRLRYTDSDVESFFPQSVLQLELIDLPKKYTDQANALYSATLTQAHKYREAGKEADHLVANLRFRQSTELFKVPVLAAIARNYLEQGKSVIIFVNFRDTLFALSQLFKTQALIYGEQKQTNREKIIDAFQSNKIRLILATYSAGGQSLSLHDLHGGHQRVSLICPMYHAIALQQIFGRTKRAMSKTVPVMKLIYAAGTIEEKVAQSVQSKLKNIASLNDGDLSIPGIPEIESEIAE